METLHQHQNQHHNHVDLIEQVLLAFSFAAADDQHSHSLNPRQLQPTTPPTLPNYTSPPLADALAATPTAFQDDQVIDNARAAAANNTCNSTANKCMIPFLPPPGLFENETMTLGVLWYGGALVDPRSYSPLARTLATRYGLAVLIPIFSQDIAFVPCSTGRLDIAQQVLPQVTKWVLVGHSMGGVGAMADLWTIYRNESSRLNEIAGLVMLAANLNPNIGCGPVDFSESTIPMAAVTASNDGILNKTRWEQNRIYFPQNCTFFLDIQGGNHGGFGSYNYTERKTLLGQSDGPMIIDPVVQFDLTTAAVAQVASRSGIPLPEEVAVPLSTSDGAVLLLAGASVPWTAAVVLFAWALLGMF